MDDGRREADYNLARIENKLTKNYKKAIRELKSDFNDYTKEFKEQDKKKKKSLKAGELSQEEYDTWRRNKLMQGTRYQTLLNTLAEDLVNADKTAASIVNGYIPEVYGNAMNYGTYMVENMTMYDTNFALYSRDTVAYLVSKSQLDLLPQSKVDIPKDMKWTRRYLNSAILQGVLQGDSIPKISKRLQEVSDMSRKSAIRNARTMTTSAEAMGRLDSLRRAESLGIYMWKKWSSTLDLRTRESHRLLDGEVKELEEPFSNGLMYPADPDGSPEEIYNCRCGIDASFKELDEERSLIQRESKLGEMSYEEWKYSKASEEDLNWLNYLNQVDAKYYEKQTYSGIWKNTVTVKDYKTLKDRIPAKREYYENRLETVTDPVERQSIQIYLKNLEQFEEYGNQYAYLQDQIRSINKALNSRKTTAVNAAGDERFTQERKDNAYWFLSQKEADAVFRPTSGAVWKNLSRKQQLAIYEYTAGSGSFNRPLRGYKGSWNNFVGIGNVDLDYEGSGDDIIYMTEALAQAKLPYDVWLVRGVDRGGAISFLQIDEDLWNYGSQQDLEDALLGKVIPDHAFFSCGSAKSTGFSGNLVLNVYCPAGTEALYVEPFSAFSWEGGKNWDGDSGATNFGSEFETIIQRDSYYRVTKVERTAGATYIDVEVLYSDAQHYGM